MLLVPVPQPRSRPRPGGRRSSPSTTATSSGGGTPESQGLKPNRYAARKNTLTAQATIASIVSAESDPRRSRSWISDQLADAVDNWLLEMALQRPTFRIGPLWFVQPIVRSGYSLFPTVAKVARLSRPLELLSKTGLERARHVFLDPTGQ